MIPVTQVEALLEQQRFVPGYGGPKVSVSSGKLPNLGFAVPLPENATDLTPRTFWMRFGQLQPRSHLRRLRRMRRSLSD